MNLNGVEIEDTYAEAFTMWCSRVLITAINEENNNSETIIYINCI